MMICSAKDRALDYLRYGDRTGAEIRSYLKKKGYEETEIGEATDFLKENGLIDDAAYCRRYIELGIEKRKSARRIMAELLQKGMNKEEISACLEECLTPETTLHNALAEARKYRERRGLEMTKAGTSKIMQRLAYLGYGSDVITKTMRLLKEDRDGDTGEGM